MGISLFYIVIPDDSNAKLMYYCYCVDCLLNLSLKIPKLTRIVNYNKYNLNSEDKIDLLHFCRILSPENLNGKCIFQNGDLCMSYPNNFFSISDIKNVLNPPQFIEILNLRIEIVNIMTYKSPWMEYYYYEPFSILLQSLKQKSKNKLSLVERTSQLDRESHLIEQKPASKCSSVDEAEIQIHSTSSSSQQSDIIESNIINTKLINEKSNSTNNINNNMSSSLKINIKDVSQPKDKKSRRSRKYSSGNCYENNSKEILYTEDDNGEEVYQYIRNKQAHWLCFMANRRCIRIYVCFIIYIYLFFIIYCL